MVASSESRIAVLRSPDLTIVIGPASGRENWYQTVAALVPLVTLVYFSLEVARRLFRHGLSSQHPGPTLFATLLGMLTLVGFLALTIVDALWKMYGRQEIARTKRALTITSVLGPLRRSRRFDLAGVSNIRWRERRVTAKGTSYQRLVVSFDVGARTVDLGTQLSFPEANELERELRLAIDHMERTDVS